MKSLFCHVFFHHFDQYFCFLMLFGLSSFCGKSTKQSLLRKNIFSCFLNWILGHLQSSDDDNKIVIGEISIRAIQKLSYCDQQTIVDGPNFNLTNDKISFIFPYFFVHSIFSKISSFCYNFC